MNRKELVRSLRELAQELGKDTLTQKDIRESEISTYWVRKHFRTMASAMEAAGLQPSKLARSMVTSDDELLDYLYDLQRRLGQRPTYFDIDGEGRFSQRIFFSRFGSLENALSQLKEREVPVEEHPRVQPPSLMNKIAQAVQEYEGGWQQRLEELEQIAENLTEENQKLRAELVALQAALQEERESPPSELPFEHRIVDQELRNDCVELLRNEKYYIDAIRRASVVLETRLREAIGGTGASVQYGAALVHYALDKDSGRLIISEHSAEQEGVHALFSGAFAFVRNPPAHKKLKYTEVEAWQVISLIDYLLSLLRQAKPRKRLSAAASRTSI